MRKNAVRKNCLAKLHCHPEPSEGSAVAFAFAFCKSPNQSGIRLKGTGVTTRGSVQHFEGSVTGHDFSRAGISAKYRTALAPEGLRLPHAAFLPEAL
jgi:hypothetical protein